MFRRNLLHIRSLLLRKMFKFLLLGNLTALCVWELSKHWTEEEGQYMITAVSEHRIYTIGNDWW